MENRIPLRDTVRHPPRPRYAKALNRCKRLAALGTGMKSVVGNGQPARITKLAVHMTKVQRWQWWMAGLEAGVVGVLDLAVRLSKH